MKLKKLFLFVSFIIVVLSLTSCNFSFGSLFGHIHNINYDIWEKDESGHWRKCSGCSEKFDFHEHSYDSYTSETCLVCKWQRDINNLDKPNDDKNDKPNGDQNDKPSVPQKITDAYINENGNSKYGYDWLATLANGDKLQSYYREIDNLAKKVLTGEVGITTVSINGKSYYTAGKIETKELSLDDIQATYNVYCYDHPYYFWQSQAVAKGYTTTDSETINYSYLLLVDEYNSKNKILAEQLIINNNIKKMYAEADTAKSTYEVVLAYYRAIAVSCDYKYINGLPADASWSHNIVGVFDDSPATGPVCEGYARAFQLLLNLKKIDNVYCLGYAANVGTGGGGAHAWNMVKLEDDNWYYFDLTWDDSNDANGAKGGTLRYDYFAVSSNAKPNGYAFTKTHLAGTPNQANGYFLYNLPTASSTAYSEIEFTVGKTYSDLSFVYVRNGLRTVGIQEIKLSSSPVTIPKTIIINNVTYNVIELGPYINDEGQYTSVLKSVFSRSLIIPKTITAIRPAAFYSNGQITIFYEGTKEDWNKVIIGSNAFFKTPKVYYSDEWELKNGVPFIKQA